MGADGSGSHLGACAAACAGHIPVKLQALPEGTVVYAHVPFFPSPPAILLLHAGYMPVKLQALREGTVVHAHVPIFQLTAEGPYAPLCTYLETLLTHVWYPTTVATLR